VSNGSSNSKAAAAKLTSFEVILSSIGDAVIATDIDGNVSFLNAVAQALTGWTLDDARGQPLPKVFRIVNEDTREEVENPALRAIREGIVFGLANHTLLIAKDGTEIPIDDSGSPIRDYDGSLLGAVLVFRDISDRRRAEKVRGQLAAIVDSSEDAIISKSLDGIIDSWNSGAEQLFEYSADEVIGKPITIIIPPDHIDEEEMILKRLRKGERIEHFETVRVSKSGRALDIDLTVSPVRNRKGEIVGASKIARDISARKQADLDRARLLDREQEARRLAEAASLAKDEFVAQISHEIRTPLNSILGWATMLRSGQLEGAQTARALEAIERNAKVQIQLIEDLMDISRIIKGQMQLRIRPVEIQEIVQAALDSIRPAAAAKLINLQTQVNATSRFISGDPDRLQQVLWNLLSNAVKFTPAGGHIDVTVNDPGRQLQIIISDSGVGISAEFLPQVFDRFTRARAGSPEQNSGLGLGLAIVRQLVELHGGTITAASPGEGQGATFTITLPVMADFD
jgi:PAS domain S-box-containing protein